jgi:hypothetical protein
MVGIGETRIAWRNLSVRSSDRRTGSIWARQGSVGLELGLSSWPEEPDGRRTLPSGRRGEQPVSRDAQAAAECEGDSVGERSLAGFGQRKLESAFGSMPPIFGQFGFLFESSTPPKHR